MSEYKKNGQPITSGFTQAGVYARRQFCADLEVYRPPEPLCNPRLREAATTLAVMRDSASSRTRQKIRLRVICNLTNERKMTAGQF